MSRVIGLLKRVPNGLETDKFIFSHNGKKVTRTYGNRYTDREALQIFKHELSMSFSERKTHNSMDGCS